MRAWSCDTFVVSAAATRGGRALLGKNSDRPIFDSQPLRLLPRRPAQASRRLRLAYVEIQDDGETHAHLGGSPYWCWGHEVGLNEFGVAIGNEALFTRDVAGSVAAVKRGGNVTAGVLGMELVRLGLERGRTAEQAVQVMAGIVSEYGQWGSGVPGSSPADGAYDNSFLVADPHEAWVLETSGRRWVAKRVEESSWSVSNLPTIRTAWDRASADLERHAVDSGWWPPERAPFDFARAYADPGTPLQVSQIRLARSRQLLGDAIAAGGVGVEDAKRVLRDHYEDTFLGGPYFSAALPDFLSLCMHSHPAGFTWGNTASSVVCVLPAPDQGLPYMWWTPLTPCTGIYVPVFVHAAGVPESFTRAGSAARRGRPEDVPADTFSRDSYWWRFAQLLERVKGSDLAWDFEQRRPMVRQAFDPLEARWLAQLPDVEKQAWELLHNGRAEAGAELLAAFTDDCAREALGAVDALLREFPG
ncbi:peptidase C69 family protein [Flindersiella endophytica]